MQNLPFVSVIIPIYNQAILVDKMLQHLSVQTYPSDKFEIIVVDNGSTDNTKAIVEQYPVIYLEQLLVKSPYPSRNMGIRHAKGSIIALIDISFPMPIWLEAGVKALFESKADFAGGSIVCDYTLGNIAGMTDALLFINPEAGVKSGSVPAANIFVTKEVIDSVGAFDEDIRSNGDSVWSEKILKSGFKLAYAEHASTVRLPKNLKQLLKKAYRIGKGNYQTRKRRNIKLLPYLVETVRLFLPPRPKLLKQAMTTRGLEEISPYFWKIWLLTWRIKVNRAIGRLNF